MYSEKVRAELLGGALADHKNHYAGYCQGYYMTIVPQSEGYRVTVNASLPTDPGNAALYSFLERARGENKKIASVGVTPYRFFVMVKAVMSQKKIPEQINGVMEPILRYIAGQGYTSGCGCCGTTGATLSCYQANNEILQMCEPCAVQMEQELKGNQKAVRAKKSNFVGGIAGALLGALLGSIVWIIIHRLGYIAGIAGLIMVVCAMKGYSMLGGTLDRKGVIISVVLSLVMVYFANKIAWTWEAYSELKDYGYSFFEIFRNLIAMAKEEDVMGDYIKDLGIGYLLTAVASVFYIRNALRESVGGYTFKKVQ